MEKPLRCDPLTAQTPSWLIPFLLYHPVVRTLYKQDHALIFQDVLECLNGTQGYARSEHVLAIFEILFYLLFPIV